MSDLFGIAIKEETKSFLDRQFITDHYDQIKKLLDLYDVTETLVRFVDSSDMEFYVKSNYVIAADCLSSDMIKLSEEYNVRDTTTFFPVKFGSKRIIPPEDSIPFEDLKPCEDLREDLKENTCDEKEE